jgi:hypothetical protein
MSGQDVQILAPNLTPALQTGTTGPNGDFVFDYTSPAGTGNFTVTANIGGKSDVQTLQVQTTSTVPPVTTPITSASISANPSVVAVNVVGARRTGRRSGRCSSAPTTCRCRMCASAST